MAVIINLPQRYQAVDGVSPFNAGIRLLPLLLSSPIATASSGYLTSNLKVPPVYLIITGAALQLLGVGLASSIPEAGLETPTAMYGYEVLMGFGFGFGLTTLLILAPLIVEKPDLGKTTTASEKKCY